MYLYTSAAPFQNRQVRGVKPIPTALLATTKLDKSPPWSECKVFQGKLEAGFFCAKDLAATREYLYDKRNSIPEVAVTHEGELR